MKLKSNEESTLYLHHVTLRYVTNLYKSNQLDLVKKGLRHISAYMEAKNPKMAASNIKPWHNGHSGLKHPKSCFIPRGKCWMMYNMVLAAAQKPPDLEFCATDGTDGLRILHPPCWYSRMGWTCVNPLYTGAFHPVVLGPGMVHRVCYGISRYPVGEVYELMHP